MKEFLIFEPETSSVNAAPLITENINIQLLEEECNKADFKWTANQNRLLLDLYKKYRNKVGSFGLKNLKQMWQKIANELKTELKIEVTDVNCQNRWKVVERNYKKYVDNTNSTGRGRKYFEYVEEMEVYWEKRNLFIQN